VPVTEKRKKCTEYDPADKNKCVKEVEVDIRCRRRTITVATTARLVAIKDGSIRYTRPLSARDQQTWCPDRAASRTAEDYVEWAEGDQVQAIRRDLAPIGYAIDVRVDENRKGLAKPAADSFKEAVRLTKSDPSAACEAWAGLTRAAEPTAALAFNLGLCAEMDRDFDAAIDWYGQAQRLGSKNRDIGEGIARIDRHRRALADWAARKRLMGVN
jgi:tetratricopeptide (TPR) repeat protein